MGYTGGADGPIPRQPLPRNQEGKIWKPQCGCVAEKAIPGLITKELTVIPQHRRGPLQTPKDNAVQVSYEMASDLHIHPGTSSCVLQVTLISYIIPNIMQKLCKSPCCLRGNDCIRPYRCSYYWSNNHSLLHEWMNLLRQRANFLTYFHLVGRHISTHTSIADSKLLCQQQSMRHRSD